MKNKVILLILGISVFVSCTKEKTEIYGSNFGFLGIVKNNTLNIYYYADKWIEMPERNFTLQGGDKILHFDRGLVAVLRDGELKTYSFPINTWIESDKFTPPKGYKDIFYKRFGYHIYLVIDNELRFYKYGRSRGWSEISEQKLLLPKKYSDMLLFSWFGNYFISVVENKELKFYELAGNSVPKEIPGFVLPRKYDKIIPYGNGIGIVNKEIVKFYELKKDDLQNEKWTENPNMEFDIRGIK